MSDENEADAPDTKWPEWNKPATKGDLMTALVAVRTCIVQAYVSMRALQREDRDTFERQLKELDKADDFVAELVEAIGNGTIDELLKRGR
ncbi:MAG TPA: hypothetical protein VGB04_08380 [Allosphingosinicella sp.]|jgi:hypothetical protein